MDQIAQTHAPDEEAKNGHSVYILAVVQFFLGTIIAGLNVLALAATGGNRKLRSGPYLLLGNLWFANLILGVIITVANVGDKPDRIALQKAEGTVSVINSLATLATFLAICTSRMVGSRSPHHRMALRSVVKVLVVIWSGIFLLVLIKTIVYMLHNIREGGVCYQCLLGFEAALLLIFAIVTVLAYVLVMYTTCVHLKTAVTDAASPTVDHAAEYRESLTLGVLLAVFTLPFVCLIVTLLTHTIYRDVNEEATEAILTLFYLHCLVNPIVFILRDADVRGSAKRILMCRRPNEDPPPTQDPDQPAFRPAYPAQNGGTRITPPTSAGNRPVTQPPLEPNRTQSAAVLTIGGHPSSIVTPGASLDRPQGFTLDEKAPSSDGDRLPTPRLDSRPKTSDPLSVTSLPPLGPVKEPSNLGDTDGQMDGIHEESLARNGGLI